MIRFLAPFSAALLMPLAALVQDGGYISNFGDEYSLEQNANGAVLRSRYPKAWFIEGGANSRVEHGIDVIYLGKSCDAEHPIWGQGKWWWANGGFGVDLDGLNYRFPRQEIDIPGSADCRA